MVPEDTCQDDQAYDELGDQDGQLGLPVIQSLLVLRVPEEGQESVRLANENTVLELTNRRQY